MVSRSREEVLAARGGSESLMSLLIVTEAVSWRRCRSKTISCSP
jgi:hypothetical protein